MILSIQSSVASGHVGNEAAVLPLQRLGFEVSAVPTVMLSNHPARGEAAGEVLAPGRVGALIGGIEKLGRFGDCRAVLSGYVGAAGTPDVVRGAVARVRAANPAAIYCCDPVMAHEGRGFFVEPPVRAAIKDALVPVADIVTPNAVELAYLTGRPVAGLDDALSAAALLRTRGPRLVVVTSLSDSGPAGPLITLAAGDDGAWAVETPRLGGDLFGAGDLFAALFLGHTLGGAAPAAALEAAVSSTFGVLKATGTAPDLALVAAQDELVEPSRRFEASKVG